MSSNTNRDGLPVVQWQWLEVTVSFGEVCAFFLEEDFHQADRCFRFS